MPTEVHIEFSARCHISHLLKFAHADYEALAVALETHLTPILLDVFNHVAVEQVLVEAASPISTLVSHANSSDC